MWYKCKPEHLLIFFWVKSYCLILLKEIITYIHFAKKHAPFKVYLKEISSNPGIESYIFIAFEPIKALYKPQIYVKNSLEQLFSWNLKMT